MRPYLNPYIAGVGLGLVLLVCFVVTGQGLGASHQTGWTALVVNLILRRRRS